MNAEDNQVVRDLLLATLEQTAAEAAAARTYADLALRRVVLAASRAGVSQREIAARIGRSQPEVHRILKQATASRDALTDQMRREERVQYELHRTLATRLQYQPHHFRELAHANLTRMRGMVRGKLAQHKLDDWQRLIDGPPDELVTQMLRTDEYGTDLRQLSPYAGALSEVERLAALERAAAHAA
ncbi:MAG: hypothetical protein ACRDTM_05750 [Micromonosporaceae bacterium]